MIQNHNNTTKIYTHKDRTITLNKILTNQFINKSVNKYCCDIDIYRMHGRRLGEWHKLWLQRVNEN